MQRGPFVIWCNLLLDEDALRMLREGAAAHQVHALPASSGESPAPAGPDFPLASSDIAFGQPNADVCAEVPRLFWVHLSSAGYTAFDRPQIRAALSARGAVLTNSSAVFSEPCAEHVLAFMLAEA